MKPLENTSGCLPRRAVLPEIYAESSFDYDNRPDRHRHERIASIFRQGSNVAQKFVSRHA
jgi:hypothetical protein